MTSTLVALVASLALVGPAPGDAPRPDVQPRTLHCCACDMPRPFNFGPRMPRAEITVITEIDWDKKIVNVTVPVESRLFASRDWTAKMTLAIDGRVEDEGILPPGRAVPLHATMPIDRLTHRACVTLLPIVPLADDDRILPMGIRPDCRDFVILEPPVPHRSGLGR